MFKKSVRNLEDVVQILCFCLFLVAASFGLTSEAHAESVNTMSSSIKPSLLSEQTWLIGVGYSPSSVGFTHRANIGDSRVSGINADTNVSVKEISLRLQKEFFSEQRISMSLLATGAYLTGSGGGRTSEVGAYTQSSNGFQFGGGASMNLNYYGMGFGIQPFLSAEILSQTTSFEVDYKSNSIPVQISNTITSVVMQPSVGVRVFDPHTSMMSYLSVGTAADLSSSIESQVNVSNEGAGSFANPAAVDPSDFFVRLGFGVFF